MVKIIRLSNPYCSFNFQYHRVGTSVVREGPAFAAKGKCQFDDCHCSLRVELDKTIKGIMFYDENVHHSKDDIKARHVRRSERRNMYPKFSTGSAKLMKLQINKLSKIDDSVYESGNRDGKGTTH